MSDPEDNGPDTPETPPDSNPPVDPVPADGAGTDPVNPLIQGMLTALEPVFKKMETSVTNLERRAVDQQKQIEDLMTNTTKLVEDKVVQAIHVYEQSRAASEGAEVVQPGQTPFDRPAAGGVMGFVQQIMGWVTSPQGQQLVGQYMTPRTPGLITIDANDIFGQSIERTIRQTAINALRDKFGALPALNEVSVSEPVHQVVGDHI